MAKTRRKRLLLVEDDEFLTIRLVDALANEGYEVVTATTGTEALDKVRRFRGSFGAAILDVMMRRGGSDRDLESGVLTGLSVGRHLKKRYPRIRLLGCSVLGDESVVEWFTRYGAGYLRKPVKTEEILDALHFALHGRQRRTPRCFIVHGHDEEALRDLLQFLHDDLGFPDTLVLREQPDQGRTIIEKFEETSEAVDVALVLLTPDDVAYSTKTPKDRHRRARQNVIFELGYFCALMGRRKGKLILLYKGKLDLPSDISGVVYVDISNGIRSARRRLRKEFGRWL